MDLQTVVVRGGRPSGQVDITEAAIGAQEIRVQSAGLVRPVLPDRREWIAILRVQIDEARRVRHLVYVSLFAQVAGERADVTDLYDGLETDVLLNAKAEVIVGRRMRLDFDRIDGTRRTEGCADEIRQINYVAEVDGQRAIDRRIVDQIAARRTAAGARCVIDAAHAEQHSLALAEQVPSKPDARLKINRLSDSVASRCSGVSP